MLSFPTMWTFATALVCLGAGYEIARFFFRRPARALERLAAAILAGSVFWLASVWLLALVHLLIRPLLLARTLVVALVALVLMLRRRRRHHKPEQLPQFASASLLRARIAPLLIAVPLVPVALWIAFVLWRGAIVPPLTHDALAYHLPRAVLLSRMEGFAEIDLPIDRRIRILPANYELLLADSLLLDDGDRYTEWLSTYFYCALIIVCGALVQRWWASCFRSALAAMILTAGAPILLLQSGADKNDIMVAFFMVSALLWSGRWLSEGELSSLALVVVALAAATGTKPQGVMLAVALAPVLIWGAYRHRERLHVTPVRFGRAFAFCLAAALLLGGWHYVVRTGDAEQKGFVAYDDWGNLWQAPWFLLTAPFSPSPDELYVPWSAEPWFWKRYEIYFSHLGIPFAISAVLLPLAIVSFRRDVPHASRERVAVALAALATLLLLLPVRDVPMPHGIFVAALPRYCLFILPIVFGWTLVPALERFTGATPVSALLFLYLAAAWFSREAFDNARRDRFVPIEYVQWARRHPGTRLIPFRPDSAASVADRIAPENEKIALDAGYGTWIHPAFGPHLRRPVEFIAPSPGPPVIGPDAKWVVVDRNWAIVWRHPHFRDLSDWRKYLGKGLPAREDVRTIRYLLQDPRFELVYFKPAENQAVFHRR